jgi:hypothetical protein
MQSPKINFLGDFFVIISKAVWNFLNLTLQREL